MSSSADKYLARHAEPEAREPAYVDGPSFPHVLVMPACRESIVTVGPALDSIRAADADALTIVVVNGTEDAGAATHVANAELLAALSERAAPDLLVIDRASEGRRLPPGEGVGLARKIGADVALARHLAGRITSPWLHWSDADALQPSDRFVAAERTEGASVALAFPFVHEEDDAQPALSAAIRRYDLWLRYYVAGLEWAGSPYAFHTIGSTQSVRFDAYASVRGMPKRQGAEDFYLFNKLRKVGEITEPAAGPVRLMARRSDRVPFGTGRGVERILEEEGDGREPEWLAPESFAVLRTLLRVAEPAAEAADPSAEGAVAFAQSLEGSVAAELPGEERRVLAGAFSAIGLAAPLRRLPFVGSSPAYRRRAFHTAFDGFRTLKFLHALRDAGHGTRPWAQAATAAPFFGGRAVD